LNLTLVPIQGRKGKKICNLKKREGSGKKGSKGRGKRELKNLESSVNYEGRKKGSDVSRGSLCFK